MTDIHVLHTEIHTSFNEDEEVFTHAVQINRQDFLDEEHGQKLAADAFATALRQLGVVTVRDKELLLAFGLWLADLDEGAPAEDAVAIGEKVDAFLADWADD